MRSPLFLIIIINSTYSFSKLWYCLKYKTLNHSVILKIIKSINQLNENQIAVTDLGISVVRFDNAIKAEKRDIQNLQKVLSNPFNQSLQNDLLNALISQFSEKHKLDVNKSLILQALGLNSP